MGKNKEKTMQIVAMVLCCVMVAALAAIMMHSSGKFNVPKNSEKSTEQPNSQIVTEEDKTSEPNEPTESEDTTAVIERDLNSVSILVNKDYPVPEEWKVDLVNLRNNQKIDRRAYDALQKMFDDARAEGFEPLIVSSYRTNKKQQTLYNNKVNQYKNDGHSEEEAKVLAAQWVALPGTSEHELGLAADIVTVDNQNLDESQLNSECQKWLVENSWKYGFILRYPDDKKELTNINFEPWHYRYVGEDAAKEIHEKGICLEEYAAQNN